MEIQRIKLGRRGAASSRTRIEGLYISRCKNKGYLLLGDKRDIIDTRPYISIYETSAGVYYVCFLPEDDGYCAKVNKNYTFGASPLYNIDFFNRLVELVPEEITASSDGVCFRAIQADE